MNCLEDKNQRIVLVSRPVGAPKDENFRLEEVPVPEPADGEVLLRVVYLSLDPYMRGRMKEAASYAAPVAINDVMVGGTVGQIVASRNPEFEEGEWVLSYSGWQRFALSDGSDLVRLGKNPENPSWALGVLGMPGFTAYMGLMDIGQPRAGDTLVVAAATGPVGSTVGQLGKLNGCRVVGVAGGPEKCRFAVETLGFDACLDRKAADFADQLQAACADGFDVYLENVGGKVFDAVLPLLNPGARVPVCGLVSMYNATGLPEGPDRLSVLMANILIKRIKMQGFIILQDYGHRYGEFAKAMTELVATGKIRYKEDMVNGLKHAPEAFRGMLEGKNFGKLVIKVSEPV